MYISPEIVVGFHGCDKTIFDQVIKQGVALSKSENDYDWLGHGVYFWEGSYERALEWAKKNPKVKNAAVIGAFIKLGHCLNLLDLNCLKQVKATYDILKLESIEYGQALPQNKLYIDNISFVRALDCKVILRLQQLNNEFIAQDLELSDMLGQNKRKIQNHLQFIDSVRGMFPEGEALYEGAGFRAKNHIQLCIINPNSIIGYFDPIQHNSWYKQI